MFMCLDSSLKMPNSKTTAATVYRVFFVIVMAVSCLWLLTGREFVETMKAKAPIPACIDYKPIRPSSFHLTAPNTSVFLYIGVMSAPSRWERRLGIRQTWFQHCDERTKCVFFTDKEDMDGKRLSAHLQYILAREKEDYSDMIFSDAPGGLNFARRILWMLEYALNRTNFRYFLRIDDDHFLCLRKLLWELPQRESKTLIWGYQHCVKTETRLDEGWYLMSVDVATAFVGMKNRGGGGNLGINRDILHTTRKGNNRLS